MKFLFLLFILVVLLPSEIISQWYPQNSGTSSSLVFVQFIDQNTGWAIGNNSQTDNILFKTTNGGVDWFEQDTLSISPGVVTSFYFLNNSVGWLTGYQLNETSEIYKTTDGGNSWFLQYWTFIFETAFDDIQFVDSLNGFSVGFGPLSAGYVYKTTDGGNNWSLSLGADSAIMIRSLSFINKDSGWVAGANIFRTTNGGVTWQEQLNIEPDNFNSIRFVNSNVGWASAAGSIFKTINGGNSWFQQSAIASTRTYFFDTSNGWLIYGSEIFNTNDGGNNWILQNSNSADDLQDIYFIDQSLGWAVGNNGTILHTINGGIPVELESFTAEIIGNEVVLKWQTATETNNRGFEVQRSEDKDQGMKWTSLGFVAGNGTTTLRHLYSYKDKNPTPGKYYYRLKQIDYDGKYKYSSNVEIDLAVSTKFALEQNYPNPFNPVTKIKFTVPTEGFVNLKVYDAIGNEVRDLVKEQRNPGTYEVSFDASELSSGVYFYQIKAGLFIETKKMILLR